MVSCSSDQEAACGEAALPKLGLFFCRGFELGHDLQDAVPTFLGLIEFEVEFRRVFDVESLVDLRLPLFL